MYCILLFCTLVSVSQVDLFYFLHYGLFMPQASSFYVLALREPPTWTFNKQFDHSLGSYDLGQKLFIFSAFHLLWMMDEGVDGLSLWMGDYCTLWMDGWMGWWTGWMDGLNGLIKRLIEGQIDSRIDRQTKEQTDGKTNRRTNRQRDRQAQMSEWMD